MVSVASSLWALIFHSKPAHRPTLSPMSDARHHEYTLKPPGSGVCQDRRSSPPHLTMGRTPLRYTVRLDECLHQQLVSSDKYQFLALYRLLNCSLNTTQPRIRVRLTTGSRGCRQHNSDPSNPSSEVVIIHDNHVLILHLRSLLS